MLRPGPAVVLALALAPPARAGELPARVVGHVTVDLGGVTLPAVPDAAKLLGALARSPDWAVSAVTGEASLRVVTNDDAFTPRSLFLNEWVAAGRPELGAPPKLTNAAWRDAAVVDLRVTVQTTRPDDAEATVGGAVELPLHGSEFDEGAGPNSWTTLGLPLGAGVWLTVREQGTADRGATRHAVDVVAADLQTVTALPAGWFAKDVYAATFAALGGPGAVRYAGLEDRDALGLVFVTEPGFDYRAVRVDVTDRKVCHGSCTQDGTQAEKALTLGAPPPGDLAFVLVEDNAVYLQAAANRRYGTFSGTRAFSADVRWSDATGRAFFATRGLFRGWER